MDLHLTAATATDRERRAVATVLGPQGDRADTLRTAAGGHADRERRHLLLPVLHAVQRGVGWISEGAVNHVAERLVVPPAEVYGVASFYALFATRPRAGTVVHVCDDVACIPNGAAAVRAAARSAYGEPGGDDEVTWQPSPCLGLCDRAPAVFVQRSGEDAADAAVCAVGPGRGAGPAPRAPPRPPRWGGGAAPPAPGGGG
ncbi:MAG: NAD(P)H-dependent oxidoreductase subunit E, partial [Actinomycetota bacterium]